MAGGPGGEPGARGAGGGESGAGRAGQGAPRPAAGPRGGHRGPLERRACPRDLPGRFFCVSSARHLSLRLDLRAASVYLWLVCVSERLRFCVCALCPRASVRISLP